MREAILADRPERAIDFAALGEDARLSVPTPDHYWPLLYVLGARRDGDAVEFGSDRIEHGSLGMTGVLLAPEPGRLPEPEAAWR